MNINETYKRFFFPKLGEGGDLLPTFKHFDVVVCKGDDAYSKSQVQPDDFLRLNYLTLKAETGLVPKGEFISTDVIRQGCMLFQEKAWEDLEEILTLCKAVAAFKSRSWQDSEHVIDLLRGLLAYMVEQFMDARKVIEGEVFSQMSMKIDEETQRIRVEMEAQTEKAIVKATQEVQDKLVPAKEEQRARLHEEVGMVLTRANKEKHALTVKLAKCEEAAEQARKRVLELEAELVKSTEMLQEAQESEAKALVQTGMLRNTIERYLHHLDGIHASHRNVALTSLEHFSVPDLVSTLPSFLQHSVTDSHVILAEVMTADYADMAAQSYFMCCDGEKPAQANPAGGAPENSGLVLKVVAATQEGLMGHFISQAHDSMVWPLLYSWSQPIHCVDLNAIQKDSLKQWLGPQCTDLYAVPIRGSHEQLLGVLILYHIGDTMNRKIHREVTRHLTMRRSRIVARSASIAVNSTANSTVNSAVNSRPSSAAVGIVGRASSRPVSAVSVSSHTPLRTLQTIPSYAEVGPVEGEEAAIEVLEDKGEDPEEMHRICLSLEDKEFVHTACRALESAVARQHRAMQELSIIMGAAQSTSGLDPTPMADMQAGAKLYEEAASSLACISALEVKKVMDSATPSDAAWLIIKSAVDLLREKVPGNDWISLRNAVTPEMLMRMVQLPPPTLSRWGRWGNINRTCYDAAQLASVKVGAEPTLIRLIGKWVVATVKISAAMEVHHRHLLSLQQSMLGLMMVTHTMHGFAPKQMASIFRPPFEVRHISEALKVMTGVIVENETDVIESVHKLYGSMMKARPTDAERLEWTAPSDESLLTRIPGYSLLCSVLKAYREYENSWN